MKVDTQVERTYTLNLTEAEIHVLYAALNRADHILEDDIEPQACYSEHVTSDEALEMAINIRDQVGEEI